MSDGFPQAGLMDTGTFPDARRWVRHRVDIRLKLTATSADGSTSTAYGRGNTLSHGGIGAYVPCSLAKGSSVSVELTFPGTNREVKIKATVRSSEGFRYGLEFVDLPPSLQALVAKCCDDSDVSC